MPDRAGGPGYVSTGLPRADTGNPVLDAVSDSLTRMANLERRIDPFFRPAVDAILRDRLSELIRVLINKQRADEGYKLAEERLQPNEEADIQAIIDSLNAQTRRNWNPGVRSARRQYQNTRRRARRIEDP